MRKVELRALGRITLRFTDFDGMQYTEARLVDTVYETSGAYVCQYEGLTSKVFTNKDEAPSWVRRAFETA